MRVVGCLSDVLFDRLCQRLGDGFVVERAQSVDVMMEQAAGGRARIACVDLSRGPGDIEHLRNVIALKPHVSVFVYTLWVPDSAAAITRLVAAGAKGFLVAEWGDNPTAVREAILRVAQGHLSTAFAQSAVHRLSHAPKRVARAVGNLFHEPQRYHCALDIALAAETSVPSVGRWLRAAGYASARRVFIGAKLAGAHELLCDPAQSLLAVAAKLNYTHPRVLTGHLQEVFGSSSRSVRGLASSDGFRQKLETWMNARAVGSVPEQTP